MSAKTTRSPEARRRRQREQRQRLFPLVHALGEELVAKFPHTFFREPAQVQPLKKGIAQDLRAMFSCSGQVLHGVLHFYTTRPAYLRALAAGRPRIDLSGQCAGSVSPEEQQEAMDQLKARQRPRRGKKPHQPATLAAEVPVDTTIPGSLP
jgi:sRNA-binding protein